MTNFIWMRNCLLLAMALVAFVAGGCSKRDFAPPHAETEVRNTLTQFLPIALDEFVHQLGSTRTRWETPYVTAATLVLVSHEFSRLDAFSEGLKWGRTEYPILKPPTPRSFWLPIAAKGEYSFEIEGISVEKDSAVAKVRFTCFIQDRAVDYEVVSYHCKKEDGTWKIHDVADADGGDLRDYLTRPNVMSAE